jgi:hypothetical protein
MLNNKNIPSSHLVHYRESPLSSVQIEAKHSLTGANYMLSITVFVSTNKFVLVQDKSLDTGQPHSHNGQHAFAFSVTIQFIAVQSCMQLPNLV